PTSGNSRILSGFGRRELVRVDADGATLTDSDSGATYSNEGASAEANFALPAAAKGLTFTFACQDSSGIKATAAAGDTIRIGGSVSAAAGTAASTAIGSTLTLTAINATEWIATASTGTWTVT